jgi:hypothetical protein
MKFTVEVIPHVCQRYNTVGDWQFREDETLVIRVSDLGDWRMELAIAIHELIETYLCKEAGVTEEMVDDFDLAWVDSRKPGDTSEPGDDPRAPYHKQHVAATRVERLVCLVLGVSWRKYIRRTQEAMLHYDF